MMSLAADILDVAERLLTAGIRDQIDLKREYGIYNRMYFNGECPDVQLKWTKSKTVGGIARARRKDGVLTPYQVTISTFYEMDAERFKGLMLHEMIHVWLFAQNLNVGHGPEFKAKLKVVSAKSGVDIPLTDDTKDLAISKGVKLPKYVAVFVGRSTFNQMYLFSFNAFHRIRDDLERIFQARVDKDPTYRVLFVESQDEDLSRNKRAMIKMSKRGMRFYRVDAPYVSGIVNGGKVLGQLKPGRQDESLTEMLGLLNGIGEYLAKRLTRRYEVGFLADSTITNGWAATVVRPKKRAPGSVVVKGKPGDEIAGMVIGNDVAFATADYDKVPTPARVEEMLDEAERKHGLWEVLEAFGVAEDGMAS